MPPVGCIADSARTDDEIDSVVREKANADANFEILKV
jgi:hypothetical protein